MVHITPSHDFYDIVLSLVAILLHIAAISRMPLMLSTLQCNKEPESIKASFAFLFEAFVVSIRMPVTPPRMPMTFSGHSSQPSFAHLHWEGGVFSPSQPYFPVFMSPKNATPGTQGFTDWRISEPSFHTQRTQPTPARSSKTASR